MSSCIYGRDQITIEELVEGGKRCGVIVTKIDQHLDHYMMTWNNIESDFILSYGQFVYSYETEFDDKGIVHILAEECGLQLVSWDEALLYDLKCKEEDSK